VDCAVSEILHETCVQMLVAIEKLTEAAKTGALLCPLFSLARVWKARNCIYSTNVEIDSLHGGYQGEWFGHILRAQLTDKIDGADRWGGWSRLSDKNIPEYIDGKVRWRPIHTIVLDSSPSVIQSVGLEPSTSPV
jgi:hypothetical protein